jgi:xanthine dehydrogenase large subunit
MPVLDPLVEVETPTRIVRVPTIHDSAARQVSGTAVFIDDIREPEGTLHVAPGGAAAAHGRIKRLGLDAVRAAAGVVRVITPADIPGKNDCSPVRGDDPILTESIVDFHGQVLFAVVAETRDAARRAAQLAEIEIEPEPAVITVDQALAAEHRLMPDYTFRKGDSAAALAAGPRRLSGTMLIGGQDHFYLEGQIAFAIPREDTMFVHSSSQHPCEVQAIIAKMLKLPQAAVIVETRRMGGGFGGKETQAAQWASLAALAAWLTRRPCKVRLDRDDDMCMTGKRHDFRANYDVAFDDTGAIRGYEVMLASRCGYSNDVSSAINDRAMYHADNAYYLPATTIVSKRMKTHTVSNTAFRGFGGPQGMVAIERVIDAIAWSLALDPLDVRKRNFYGNGERDMTPYGMRVTDNVIHELVDTLEKTSDYRQRRAEVAAFNADSRFLKRGLALTPVKFGISFTNIMLNQAGALVHLYNDGTVHVNHGGTEMGQGTVHQGRAGGRGGVWDRPRSRADYRHGDRQGAERVGDRGFVRLRPQRHGRAGRGAHDQDADDRVRGSANGCACRPDPVSRESGFHWQPCDPISRGGAEGLGGTHLTVVDWLLRHAEDSLGPRQGDRPALLLLRVRRGVRRGARRRHDRRDEGPANGHPSRRGSLAQPGS